MKKGLVITLISMAASVLPVTSSMAAKSTANVALTSNYVFRGQTYSNDSLAVQAGYDYKQHKDKGLYAGTFVSTVDGGTNGGSGLEIDVFAGWKGVFGQGDKMGYDVGVKLYNFTDSSFFIDDITEIIGGISYETAYVKLALGNASGGSNYEYLDIGATFTVLKDIDLDLHFGHYLSSQTLMI